MTKLVSVSCVIAVAAIGAVATPCAAQTKALPLRQAADVSELQVGPWGPYAVGHTGPTYLADRFRSQLFSFPIVIGQRRIESRLLLDPANKRLSLRTVALERRSMGLAPVSADADDRPDTQAAWRNRRAVPVEADAGGTFWEYRIIFAPAELTDAVAGATEPAPWGAADVIVDCCPAFAEPAADGLPIRITITNRSDSIETFYADLLGGMGTLADGFTLKDLVVERSLGSVSMSVRHAASQSVFALAGDNANALHLYRVSNTYFGPASRISERDASGAFLPNGIVTVDRPVGDTAATKEIPSGLWALARADDISIGPGETRTIIFCVGVGKDPDEARKSASSLIRLSQDITADRHVSRQGAFTKAEEAHRAARFQSGDAALDRLMVQSLVNIPFVDWRRIGVASRERAHGLPGGEYDPVSGGFIALGWAPYRPDWAAEQVNAFLLSRGDPTAPIEHPRATPPINLLALWDIEQQTGDRGLLERFYPYARRRYRELLLAGRTSPDGWLFAWPPPSTDDDTVRGEAAAVGRKGQSGPGYWAAPDYSAYVVRAATIMRRLAERLVRPPVEAQEYQREAREAQAALDAALWDARAQSYSARLVGGSSAPLPQPPAGSLAELLPLIDGPTRLPAERAAALLKRLTDPQQFWSPYGLRGRSKSAPAFRPDNPTGGAVSFGLSWLFWKALLDMGEADTARRLAEALVSGYRGAALASGRAPESVDSHTGGALGVPDSSGESMALIPIYVAYHRPGSVTSGWSVDITGHRYDAATDNMHLVFRSSEATGKSIILCAMGRPRGVYAITGSLTMTLTADATGVITVTSPPDTTTQGIDIAPSPAAR